MRLKTTAALLVAVACLMVGGMPSSRAQTLSTDQSGTSHMTKIKVIVGDQTLTATLDDTTAGRDFAAMMPLDLTLSDYHGIEKIADLPREVDSSGAPKSYGPSVGDITIYAPWGNLAIFYKPFPASRGLVRLGAFDGSIDALKKSGSFTARFERAE